MALSCVINISRGEIMEKGGGGYVLEYLLVAVLSLVLVGLVYASIGPIVTKCYSGSIPALIKALSPSVQQPARR
jgi:hypothetical protein